MKQWYSTRKCFRATIVYDFYIFIYLYVDGTVVYINEKYYEKIV